MFDTPRFLRETFINPDGLVGLFNAYRIPIPAKDTVRKWFSRGSVPSEWFAMSIALLELERGERVSLVNFISLGGADA